MTYRNKIKTIYDYMQYDIMCHNFRIIELYL
jgi:hypothetical protein